MESVEALRDALQIKSLSQVRGSIATQLVQDEAVARLIKHALKFRRIEMVTSFNLMRSHYGQ